MRRPATSALVAAALILFSTPVFAAEADGSTTGQSALSSVSSSWLKSWSNLPQTIARSWQCVTFARFFSGLQIFGDAWTWWDGADGKYARGNQPEAKSVLVFRKTGSMTRGHVAVVSQVLTDRVIQMTHANWSTINGRRGQVEEDVTVVDVSENNDWSQVKVWYDASSDLGRTTYPTYGFIYQPDSEIAKGSGALAKSEGRYQLASLAGASDISH